MRAESLPFQALSEKGGSPVRALFGRRPFVGYPACPVFPPGPLPSGYSQMAWIMHLVSVIHAIWYVLWGLYDPGGVFVQAVMVT